jgi:8-amino-7-oxononanoate synthase
MLDFTSALYLGMQHASASLGRWDALTLGRPAALQEPPGASAVARGLARLQGCEAAVLLPSTLHLFWDLFDGLAEENVVIHCDAASYPIARWGAACAQARKLPLRLFPAHDWRALRNRLDRQHRPVILTDGYHPGQGRPAPLAAYAALAAERGGLLVVDDTQALGLLGARPGPAMPYGHGGGGSLAACGVQGPHVLVGASLAKAFGAPLAVLSGSAARIAAFRGRSRTAVHCSPVSAAAVGAARAALALNTRSGEGLRARLATLVERFRRGLGRIGLHTVGGTFPVQTLVPVAGRDGRRLHHALLEGGVRAVLHTGYPAASLSFVFTALHREEEIDRAVAAIAQAHARAARPIHRLSSIDSP